MLSVGDPAPNFRLIGTTGNAVTLKELRGTRVVLYFYPRDDTPGCTREACSFRDNLGRLRAAGAQVFGVSKDSLASHDRFRTKYGLTFELLSDPDNSVATAYGAYGEKSMYGKKVMGTIRSTFLIDEKGHVRAVWSPVRVDGHVDQVLAALDDGERDAAPVASRAAKAGARKAAGAGAARRSGTKGKVAARTVARKAGKKATVRKAAGRKAGKKASVRKAAGRKAGKKAARRPARKA